jgi:hypothetical protein
MGPICVATHLARRSCREPTVEMQNDEYRMMNLKPGEKGFVRRPNSAFDFIILHSPPAPASLAAPRTAADTWSPVDVHQQMGGDG